VVSGQHRIRRDQPGAGVGGAAVACGTGHGSEGVERFGLALDLSMGVSSVQE
jgi:hypothetical protein